MGAQLGPLSLVLQPHKQVARKQGLAHHFGLAAADFFNAQQRQVAGVALALQVDQRDVLLPGLGVDQVPGGGVRGGDWLHDVARGVLVFGMTGVGWNYRRSWWRLGGTGCCDRHQSQASTFNWTATALT
jgi:hypothetical protein